MAVDQGKNASKNAIAELARETFSVTALSTISGHNRDWVRTRLKNTDPDAKVGKNAQYRISTLLDGAAGLTEAAANKKPREMKDYYDAERSKDELLKSRRQLFERQDVVRFCAEMITEMRRTTEALPDTVELECGPSVDVIETIERVVDDMNDALYQRLVAFIEEDDA